MMPRVTEVRHLQGYTLELTFSDGTIAALDLSAHVVGRAGVFAPLQDLHYFAQAAVDREAGTIAWPNGVDLCPDVLYSEATGTELREDQSALEPV